MDKEGDLNVSFPKSPGSSPNSTASGFFGNNAKEVEDGDEFEDTVLDPAPQEDRHEAWRFLLAGGVAGAGEHPWPQALRLERTDQMNSVENGDGAIRQIESVPDHHAERGLFDQCPDAIFDAAPSQERVSGGDQPVGGRHCDLQRRPGSQGVLGGQRTERDKNLPGKSQGHPLEHY